MQTGLRRDMHGARHSQIHQQALMSQRSPVNRSSLQRAAGSASKSARSIQRKCLKTQQHAMSASLHKGLRGPEILGSENSLNVKLVLAKTSQASEAFVEDPVLP